MNPETNQRHPHHLIHIRGALVVTGACLLLGVATPSSYAMSFSGLAGMQSSNLGFGNTSPLNSIACGDFNGDGVIDVASLDNDLHVLSIGIGQGDGTFVQGASPATIQWELRDIQTADLNGDGHLDLAIACQHSAVNLIRIFQGIGDGFFAEAVALSTPMPTGLTIADMNGDGLPDIATSNVADNTVTVFMNLGGFGFSMGAAFPTATGPHGLTAFDVDNDGDLDLAIACAGGTAPSSELQGFVTILSNNGAGVFVVTGTLPTGIFSTEVQAGDLNGDGWIDLAVANRQPDISVLFNNNGAGFLDEVRYDATTPSASSMLDIAISDIDGDGDLDLTLAVLRATNNGGIEILINHEGDFLSHSNITFGFNACAVRMTDVNQDLSPDVVIALAMGFVGAATNLTPIAAPDPFQLLTPADGEVGLPVPGASSFWPGTIAALDWSDSAAFHHTYTVVIATDAALTEVVSEAAGLIHSSYTVPAGILQPNTTYHWTVTAANPTGSTMSDSGVWTFSTGAPADLTGDGKVNGADLASLLANWSTPSE